MAPLQREAPNPLYMQVKEALLDEILSGRCRPHDRLPSERELSQQFDVSRMTVRQALLELARDGAIYARVGKGTFVAAPKIDQQLRTLTSFSQDVRSRGGQSTSRVLEAREMAASAEVAAACWTETRVSNQCASTSGPGASPSSCRATGWLEGAAGRAMTSTPGGRG